MTVASRISGADTKAVRIAPGSAVPKRNDPAAAETGGNPAGVDVQITGAARGLAAIEQSLRDLPAIDEARVAAVRARLDDGSYRVDPQKIADRLLNLEQELGRASPIEANLLK
jgi:negative regulator of flagellin synthesis FlgM